MRYVHQMAVAALTAVAFAPAAHAHHSFASEFDANLTGDVKGEVTEIGRAHV